MKEICEYCGITFDLTKGTCCDPFDTEEKL